MGKVLVSIRQNNIHTFPLLMLLLLLLHGSSLAHKVLLLLLPPSIGMSAFPWHRLRYFGIIIGMTKVLVLSSANVGVLFRN